MERSPTYLPRSLSKKEMIINASTRSSKMFTYSLCLNFWLSFSTPSRQSPATRFVPSFTANWSSPVLLRNSCADSVAFITDVSFSSFALLPAFEAHSFNAEIKCCIFWMIMSITSRDLPLTSFAIFFSLFARVSALLTVSSTEICLRALVHVTAASVSSCRSLSTSTLMPCFFQRDLASSKAFACSLALLASSSAQLLNQKRVALLIKKINSHDAF